MFFSGAIDNSISLSASLLGTSQGGLPCFEKSKSFGSSFEVPSGWRESGKRHMGSRSSSKKGWHIASMAERRCVGVYSSNADIKSMASADALRKT